MRHASIFQIPLKSTKHLAPTSSNSIDIGAIGKPLSWDLRKLMIVIAQVANGLNFHFFIADNARDFVVNLLDITIFSRR